MRITQNKLAYNLPMPTPFYHLSLAEEILHHPDLPEQIRDLLTQQNCTFFLGKTAPDVQTISGQLRHETHFFKVPPEDNVPPWVRFLTKHLSLSDPSQLPAAQAAFTAGYICHLQADIAWIHQIFLPTFGMDAEWGDFRQRIYYHNALRAVLDEEILQDLPENIGACVGGAQPNNWLPFVEDQHLVLWRDFLSDQLAPGAQVKTAEVFANRMGVDVEGFSTLISSPERLESELFVHISRQTLVEYRLNVIQENLKLLHSYLSQDVSA